MQWLHISIWVWCIYQVRFRGPNIKVLLSEFPAHCNIGILHIKWIKQECTAAAKPCQLTKKVLYYSFQVPLQCLRYSNIVTNSGALDTATWLLNIQSIIIKLCIAKLSIYQMWRPANKVKIINSVIFWLMFWMTFEKVLNSRQIELYAHE